MASKQAKTIVLINGPKPSDLDIEYRDAINAQAGNIAVFRNATAIVEGEAAEACEFVALGEGVDSKTAEGALKVYEKIAKSKVTPPKAKK